MTTGDHEPDIEPPHAAIDIGEWSALLLRGQQLGSVHADDVSHVLREVDLTEDVIDDVHRRLSEVGAQIDTAVGDGEGIASEAATGAHAADASESGAGGLDGPPGEMAAPEELRRAGTADRRKAGPRRPRPERTEAASGNPVQQYLKEIGRVRLLTAADEQRLAQAILDGCAASQRLERDSLDAVETRRLRRLERDGHAAKDELIQANLRLVVSVAKRYSGRGMQLLDLVQEGNLGLMRAVDKFDHTKGFKFSTYATWWIRQAITRAIADQARTIRIPVHMIEHMNRVLRTQRQLHQDLEREPTIDEVAEKCMMPVERVREILRISLDPLSLDSPVGEEDNSSLGDFIMDGSADAPADMATRKMLTEAVELALGELNDRERDIVRMRFGLDDGKPSTLEDVGAAFGVTRERVRQIEAKTLAKLRHPQRAHKLREFLEVE